jgi:hypothetical protein
MTPRLMLKSVKYMGDNERDRWRLGHESIPGSSLWLTLYRGGLGLIGCMFKGSIADLVVDWAFDHVGSFLSPLLYLWIFLSFMKYFKWFLLVDVHLLLYESDLWSHNHGDLLTLWRCACASSQVPTELAGSYATQKLRLGLGRIDIESLFIGLVGNVSLHSMSPSFPWSTCVGQWELSWR